MISGIKDTKLARMGDTIWTTGSPVEPMPGFKPAKSMVFSGTATTSTSFWDRLPC